MSTTTPGRGGKTYLAQIWRSDPYVRRFDHDRDYDYSALIGELDALYTDDPDALFELEAKAWKARDRKTYLALGAVMWRRGGLTRKISFRYSRCLLMADQNQDALDVLLDPEHVRADDAFYWSDLAEALARTGRLPKALLAVRQALTLDPALPGLAVLEKRLKHAIEVEGRPIERATWSDVRRTLDFYVELGLNEVAARLLAAFVVDIAVPPAEKPEVMRWVQSLIGQGDPNATLRLLKALRSLYPGRSAMSQIKVAIQVIRGEGSGDACAIAPTETDRDLEFCLGLACSQASAWPSAIARLGRLSLEHKRDAAIRNTLARCVGMQVLQQAPLRFCTPRQKRRIFNLIPFNNELFLLRLRLEEMADWIDRFVIVESRVTFTGRPKPLHFTDAMADFRPYADKIIHVVVDEFPQFVDSPWARDFYQRDIGIHALSGLCAEDDLLLLTDADEIVRRRSVEEFDGEFANLRMETYRYFLNNRLAAEREDQRGTGAVWRAKYLARYGSSYARFVLSQYDPSSYIYDAGWHFTSIFAPELIAQKVQSFAHQEYAHRDETYFQQVLSRIRAGESEPGWGPVDVDSSFPAYIRRNREAFGEYLLERVKA